MSRSVNIYTSFYWGSYLKNTRHLTTEQHGCYFLLLAEYYTKETALPDDNVRLARLCGVALAKWIKTHRPVLAEFFEVRDGLWIQPRAEREIASAIAGKKSRIKGAQKTNEKRWGNPPSTESPSDRSATPERPLSESPDGQSSTVNRQPSTVREELQRHAHPAADFVPPGLDAVLTVAEMQGVPPEAARKWHAEMESVGWLNKHNQALVNWQASLRSYGVSWRQLAHLKANRPGNGPEKNVAKNSPVAERIAGEARLKELNRQIAEHPAQNRDTADFNPAKADELRQLKQQRTELEEKLKKLG